MAIKILGLQWVKTLRTAYWSVYSFEWRRTSDLGIFVVHEVGGLAYAE